MRKIENNFDHVSNTNSELADMRGGIEICVKKELVPVIEHHSEDGWRWRELPPVQNFNFQLGLYLCVNVDRLLRHWM